MIYSFLYVLVFSFGLVFIQKLDVSIPPMFSLFFTATLASLYFNFLNRNTLKETYSHCLENKKNWLWVMSIVLVMWSTTMIGPGQIGASLFNFIYFVWLGVIGLVMTSLQNWRANHLKFYFGMGLLALLSVNIYFELQHAISFESLYGIFLAIVGGTFSFIYFRESQQLAKQAQLSATQILSVRFYLAIFVIFCFVPKGYFASYLTYNNIFALCLLSVISLIIPLYFSQKALEKITPEQHAIINSLCPIITGIMQEIFFHDIRTEQIIIYVLYAVAISSFYHIERLYKKSNLNLCK